MPQYPKYIRRLDDGELLKIDRWDLKYSFINSRMATPHKYSFELLMYDPRYKGSFEIVEEDEEYDALEDDLYVGGNK